MEMDKIFKIGLLVLGFSYLAYLFCPVANQVGRYQYHIDERSMTAFDTITGMAYRCDNQYSYDILKGGGVVDIIRWSKFANISSRSEEKEWIDKFYKTLEESLEKGSEGSHKEIEIKETD